jgi:hypothetical protein
MLCDAAWPRIRGDVGATKTRLPLALKTYAAVETETVARDLERYF